MSSRINAAADPKISASTVGKILGGAVLVILGGWGGLGYYKLQADVRVLELDRRIGAIERKLDRLSQALDELRDELREERKKK